MALLPYPVFPLSVLILVFYGFIYLVYLSIIPIFNHTINLSK